MKKVIIITLALFLWGCASAPKNKDSQPNLSKSQLQMSLAEKDDEIESLKVIIAEQEAKIKAKDAKIEELKKKLSTFGVFE